MSICAVFVFYRFNWSPECACICVTLCVCAVIKQRFRKRHNSVVYLPDMFPGVRESLLYHLSATSICANLLFFVSADWASAVRRETEAADWRKEGWMEGGRGGGKILICPAAAARPKQTMLERQTEESHLSWSFGSGRVCLVDLDTTVHKYPSVWVGGMFDCTTTMRRRFARCLLYFCADYLWPSALFRFRLPLL